MTVLHIVEGEKCADALGGLQLVATTSLGGAGAAEKTDWAPAARFEQDVIWQDVDATDAKSGVNPGVRYANTVAELIAAEGKKLGRVPAILIVDLRPAGLVDGQDVYDWVEAQRLEGKSDDEIRAGLESLVTTYGRRWLPRVAIAYPNQPRPYRPGRSGADGRETISNFSWVEKMKADGTKEKNLVALPIDKIRSRVQQVTATPAEPAPASAETLGWPCRVKSPGAKAPLLFVDEGQDEPRWFTGSEAFAGWLQELGALKFNPKQDCELTNYVRIGDLYHSFGGNATVMEYQAVESRPHEPLIAQHYYMWRPPADYAADGSKLAGLLKFFTNVKSPKDLALLAAAFLTPGWGGPYGPRPCFVITAPDRGCGKTTVARAIGKIWGGWISVDLTQRGDEQLKERFLSPDALMKRVPLIDNVKGTLSNPMIESMITDEWINGKRMYTGDARRPNTMTWLVTANGVRLSRDMAQRSFFIELQRPAYSANWDKAINQYITLNGDFIVADCIAILKAVKSKESVGLSDRSALWAEDVLLPACEHPAIQAVIKDEFSGRNRRGAVQVEGGQWATAVAAAEVLRANTVMREDCDEDREEAEMFVLGLMERVCGPSGDSWAGAGLIVEYLTHPGIVAGNVYPIRTGYVQVKDAEDSFFVSSDDMLKHWAAIMGKKLNSKQILHIIREHREAGRIVGVQEGCKKRTGNGYEISAAALNKYVSSVRATYELKRPTAEGGG